MSINVHIETLVLNGIDVQAHQTQELSTALTVALEAKLKELFSFQMSTQVLLPFTTNSYVKTHPVSINSSQSASDIGESIGNAVYWGIRQ
jgi:hypothetical protein